MNIDPVPNVADHVFSADIMEKIVKVPFVELEGFVGRPDRVGEKTGCRLA
jgi:hypothetical protein